MRRLPATYRAIVVLPVDVPYPGPLTGALTAAGATVLHRRMLALRRGNLQIRKLPASLWSFVAGIWTIARLIRREQVTLVHSNTVAVLCGAFAALVTRRPHLWHVHEYLSDEPVPIRVTLRLLVRLMPGAVVANSQATARSIRSPKAQVIHNAVFFEPSGERIQNDPPVIGVVGRLSTRKGIAEALDAAAILTAQHRNFRLTFIGGTPPDQPHLRAEYEAQARRLNIATITTFSGETLDPANFYNGIDILLVPSQRPEPFGLTVIEGMAAGCAVVVTRNGGGSDELLDDGVTGIYCGRDPASLAAALDRLLADPELRLKLGANARETAQRRFDPDRYAAQFLQTYSKLQA